MTMDKLLERYAPGQRSVISLYLNKLARSTRKTGIISESAKVKIVASFAIYDIDVVIASLQAYLQMDIPPAHGGKGKNERYTMGIMANIQAEKRGGGIGTHRGRVGKSYGNVTDEGKRLRQLAESTDGGELECDF